MMEMVTQFSLQSAFYPSSVCIKFFFTLSLRLPPVCSLHFTLARYTNQLYQLFTLLFKTKEQMKVMQ